MLLCHIYTLQIKIINQMNRKEQLKQSNNKKSNGNTHENSRNLLMTACAFHPTEKITNFCTNRQCLLPLCPKCVKIHTDQHIKMGIFGEFNTIEESFVQADEGLKQAVIKLGEFQRLIVDVRRQYDQKLANQKKSIRDAKNHFFEQIQRIIDQYEKAMLVYQSKCNKQFVDELYISQELIANLASNCQKAIRRLSSSQTIMEGIINYYSETQELQKIEILGQNLQKNFPGNLTITFYPDELQRMEAIMKRYIDAGRANQDIWNLHKALYHKETLTNKHYERSQKDNRKQSPKRQPKRQQSPRRQQQDMVRPKNNKYKFSDLNTLESNLNLAKFKSPLDNFSLNRLRSQNK